MPLPPLAIHGAELRQLSYPHVITRGYTKPGGVPLPPGLPTAMALSSSSRHEELRHPQDQVPPQTTALPPPRARLPAPGTAAGTAGLQLLTAGEGTRYEKRKAAVLVPTRPAALTRRAARVGDAPRSPAPSRQRKPRGQQHQKLREALTGWNEAIIAKRPARHSKAGRDGGS